MRKRRLAALAGAGGLVLSGVLLSGAPAMAASCGTGGTTWTTAHLGVVGTGGGQQSVVQADPWGSPGADTCLTVPGTTSAYASAFTVQSQTAAFTGGVLAYPNAGFGCSSGYCTTGDSYLPVAVSTDPYPIVNWTYSGSGAATGSEYDAAIDSEFSAACTGSSPAMNESIIVYTDAYPNATTIGIPHSGTEVLIGGNEWYTAHFLDGSKYVTQFAAASMSGSGAPANLNLGNFYSYVANTVGGSYWNNSDCLQTVGTGFEIWKYGAGLASSGTSITGSF